MVAAPCFSAYGGLVVAKKTASGRPPDSGSAPAALTAMVRLSSSWFATARSPGPGAPPHSFAITSRGRR